MPQLATLRSVLEEARELLAAADNDFTWSSWQDATASGNFGGQVWMQRLITELELLVHDVLPVVAKEPS